MAESEKPEYAKYSEPETEPEGISIPNAEPQVNIAATSEAWQIAFKAHWIFFATCFALLVLFNGFQLYKTYRRTKMSNRNYVLIVQSLVLLLGFTRSLALFIFPYELTSNTPRRVPYVVSRLLFSFGYPCIFSGFTFVHKIFLNVSKVQVMSRNALGNRLVSVVLVIHFIAVLVAEVITSKVKKTEFLLVICAVYYFIGCLGIAMSLLFSGRRVVRKARKIHANLTEYRHTGAKIGAPIESGKKKSKGTETTSKVIKITAFAAIFGVLCALFYVYGLVWMVRSAAGDNSSPEPWTWLIVNTFLRLFELFLAATMSYAVASSYQRSSQTRILVSHCEDTVNTPS